MKSIQGFESTLIIISMVDFLDMSEMNLIILAGAVAVVILIVVCCCCYQRRRLRAKNQRMLRNAVSFHVDEEEETTTADDDDIEANNMSSLGGTISEGITPKKVHEMANRVNDLRNKNRTLRLASKLPGVGTTRINDLDLQQIVISKRVQWYKTMKVVEEEIEEENRELTRRLMEEHPNKTIDDICFEADSLEKYKHLVPTHRNPPNVPPTNGAKISKRPRLVNGARVRKNKKGGVTGKRRTISDTRGTGLGFSDPNDTDARFSLELGGRNKYGNSNSDNAASSNERLSKLKPVLAAIEESQLEDEVSELSGSEITEGDEERSEYFESNELKEDDAGKEKVTEKPIELKYEYAALPDGRPRLSLERLKSRFDSNNRLGVNVSRSNSDAHASAHVYSNNDTEFATPPSIPEERLNSGVNSSASREGKSHRVLPNPPVNI